MIKNKSKMEKDQVKNNQDLKELVKQRYNELALNAEELRGCCCGRNPLVASKKVFTIMSEDYANLKGYEPDADLGVGYGLPTQYANISEGDIVIDLGSGMGSDYFIARAEVGKSGEIIGIDLSPQMITKVHNNALKRGYVNVEFLEGDIENMPLLNNTADTVVSNCVPSPFPERNTIFKKTYRVLKPGEHLRISDVVFNGTFSKEFTGNAAMYAGCIASAIQREDYLQEVERADFVNIRIARTKMILIPGEVLYEHLDEDTIRKYKSGNVEIHSVTVTGEKRSV